MFIMRYRASKDLTTFGLESFSGSSFTTGDLLIRLIRCVDVFWMILHIVFLLRKLLIRIAMLLCVLSLIFSKKTIQNLLTVTVSLLLIFACCKLEMCTLQVK